MKLDCILFLRMQHIFWMKTQFTFFVLSLSHVRIVVPQKAYQLKPVWSMFECGNSLY